MAPPDAILRMPSSRRGPSRLTTTPRWMATPSPTSPMTTHEEHASKSSGEASAGHSFGEEPQLDGAVRIFTGAVMPSGHDTVAMQEFVGVEEQDGKWFATVPGGLKQGANRRLAGEDSKQGTVLVTPGSRLRPQDVASAAACGLDRLCCYTSLRVAILSTGDEILRPGDRFEQGKVYDANAPMLDGLTKSVGAEPAGPRRAAGRCKSRTRRSTECCIPLPRARDFWRG